MLTNKHLLGAIVLLSVGNVVACVLLVVGEKGNAIRIAQLSGELQEAQQRQQQREAELASGQSDLSVELKETRAELHAVKEELGEAHRTLALLSSKKWLMAEDAAEPWKKNIVDLDQRIKTLEELVRKMTPPPPPLPPLPDAGLRPKK